jgi:hypothetical protein
MFYSEQIDMGHRANLLLVDETGYTLYYCHWCGKSIPEDVFWGPQYAIPFIRQQREVNVADGWLDDVWAEGGVLVDISRHTLLLWGGESLSYDIPLRRLYLELLEEVWSVWKVQWAHDSILDLARYVGFPKDRVRAKGERDPSHDTLDIPREKDWTALVASIVLEDGTMRLFPLIDLHAHDYLETGPSLIKTISPKSGFDTLPLEDWTKEFPRGGFHIDVAKKQVAFWGAYERGAVDYIVPAWDGWEVIWLQDNFEYQLARTEGRLTLPMRSTEAMLEAVTKLLLQEAHPSMVDMILRMAEEHRQKGQDVQINPNALRENPLELSLEVRQQILMAAIAGWKAKCK